MASSLLASRSSSVFQPTTSIVRGYAKKKGGLDPKKERIRRILYPSNVRHRGAPTGAWRSDVARGIYHAIPSVQAHDTIERAWLLHKRHIRKRREEELERKFESMKSAMSELQKVDNFLYLEANRPDDPKVRLPAEKDLLATLKGTEVRTLDARIRGLFPRELLAPVDTPSKLGWNHSWKPFLRPV